MMVKDLSKHITATYKALRLGLAAIALAFPLLLWTGGYLLGGLPLDGSMSAYYHAGDGVMRNEFVGILFAVGTTLIFYQGITRLEDCALNLAGVLALGVALFPMAWPVHADEGAFSVHGVCAVSFFICIAYVCIFRASDTLTLVRDNATRDRYRRSYKLLGTAMLASPAIAFVLTSILQLHNSITFFVEVVGIYVFAAYWLVKSHEISETIRMQRRPMEKFASSPMDFPTPSDQYRSLPLTTRM